MISFSYPPRKVLIRRQAGLEARKHMRPSKQGTAGKPSQQETLQIVVEIVGDLVHQVYSPAAHDVVL